MAGIPVVIATNGFGTPVKAVTGNAPTMTVAANGYGMPIVLSDNGMPFVVEGGGTSEFSLDFAAQSYSGPGGAIADPFASLLTVSRSSAAMAQDRAKKWFSFASGQPRVTDRGLLIEPATTNAIDDNQLNAVADGAAVPYTLTNAGGLTVTLVSTYVDTVSGIKIKRIRVQGTPTATSALLIRLNNPAAAWSAATSGQVWAFSAYFAWVSGTTPVSTVWRINTQAGVSVASSTTHSDLHKSLTRRQIVKATMPTSTGVAAALSIPTTNGIPIDLTFDLGGEQLERNAMSSLILTTGSGGTRAADVAAFGGNLLSKVQAGAGTVDMKISTVSAYSAGSPAAILKINGSAALSRAANFGVSSTFGGASLATSAGQSSTWAVDGRHVLTWDGSSVGAASASGTDYVSGSGSPPSVTSVSLGDDGYYLSKLVVSGSKKTDLSDIRTVNYDIVSYGTTPGSITAAIEAARKGKRVAIVGGWRDRHLGGMMSAGLGATDVDTAATADLAFGGLGREVISRINVARGLQPKSGYTFPPKFAEQVFNEMVLEDPVAIHYTGRITTVAKTGTKIDSITTAQGRTFAAKAFNEGGYEGDFFPPAGVTYIVGREASDANNTLNGLTSGGTGVVVNGKTVTIDAYVTPGNSASGLLPGVVQPPSPSTVGSGDFVIKRSGQVISSAGERPRIQAYNFRMTLTTNAGLRVPFPSTPPAGFNILDFEPFLRMLGNLTAAGGTYNMANLFIPSAIGGNVIDLNSTSAISSDYVGANWDYPEADDATRETIWQKHIYYITGLFYVLQYLDDARVPSALRTEALTYGLANDHYLDPHPNDPTYWPYYMYVREAMRMVSDVVWNGADVAATDGTASRSTKIIAAGDYVRDSHHVTHYVSGGVIRREGNFQSPAGGTDKRFPIPFEIIRPAASECTNLTTSFPVSATHEAFAAIRMELSSMCIGHAAGAALSQMIDEGTTIQNITYSTLATTLASEGQIIPTVN